MFTIEEGMIEVVQVTRMDPQGKIVEFFDVLTGETDTHWITKFSHNPFDKKTGVNASGDRLSDFDYPDQLPNWLENIEVGQKVLTQKRYQSFVEYYFEDVLEENVATVTEFDDCFIFLSDGTVYTRFSGENLPTPNRKILELTPEKEIEVLDNLERIRLFNIIREEETFSLKTEQLKTLVESIEKFKLENGFKVVTS